jgi:hypothetical protein
MTNPELRRILLADPFSNDPALRSALTQDPQLQQFAQALQQQQRQFEDALQIAVPPMLAEQLLHLPQQRTLTRRWLPSLALAASLALVSVVGVQLYQSTYAADLGSHALAHVHHEEAYLRQQASVQDLAAVNLKLADFDASLEDWQDEIIYARYCTFQGIRSLHLAIKTDSGYATVFVVPKDVQLAVADTFSDAQYQGRALVMPGAHVLIVSDNKIDLSTLPEKISHKLVFSA